MWPLVQTQAQCATNVWREPDQGIWEARGKPQQYVSSKLMCWVALDRASKLAAIRGDADLQATWGATADEIKADILEHGVDKRGVLRQHYDTDALDASTLLAAIFGFLASDDKRLRASVLAIADELTDNGFVLRYRTDAHVPAAGEALSSAHHHVDGLPPGEGAFLACSFWLVDTYALLRRYEDAERLFERLLAVANDVGLLAEEYDPVSGRQLGNFPQAFSHLSLVNTAYNLARDRSGPSEERSR